MPPKFYSAVAEVLRKLEKKQGSLKSLVFSQHNVTSKKIYALAAQTLKHKSVIMDAMESCHLLEKEPQVSPHLAMVLVYDLLYGRGIQCGGPLKQAILRHRDELKEAAKRAQERKVLQPQRKAEFQLPRYVRVNVLKTTSTDVIRTLCEGGYTQITPEQVDMYQLCHTHGHGETSAGCREGLDPSPPSIAETESTPAPCTTETTRTQAPSSASMITQSSSSALPSNKGIDRSLRQKWFFMDSHIPNVMVFSPSTKLAEHPLYLTAEIILQDKNPDEHVLLLLQASCLPAHILSPPTGSAVIDACAAPGNKTTQLASIMNNHGCVYAFDKNHQRFPMLEGMVKKAGATCVKAVCQDFLQTDPSDYPDVQYIMVDPSCTGSGIVGRIDFHTEDHIDPLRLTHLTRFQKLILKHALRFPSVERVVYSTCSVNKKENEGVVESALSEFGSEFELVHIMPEWENRGLPVFQGAQKCIRASPEENLTNGFFVALFQRKKIDQSEKFTDRNSSITLVCFLLDRVIWDCIHTLSAGKGNPRRHSLEQIDLYNARWLNGYRVVISSPS